ncbi:glycoprotein-N-acetylgalactosamine 3-beta-galactosyltransferase 1-like [Mytilus californianus]|uniref:glycoprotein-N-acetylgalactosamine 3-beta-galactosyltransferase 1-like n=1 Tax=Mytilus californianus TaxID=6549 RepID=UPI0022469944|nr:glycoprotein-N-acetylgalactosamine 3-beta-galactosyltransferase 1-like [Mytilus californianus]
MQAWRYVYEHYRDKADWFLKADDDTYVIVENLKYLLKDYHTSEPIFFGQYFVQPNIKQPFNTGGPGYVLSKEALMRLGTRGNNSKECKQDGESEDGPDSMSQYVISFHYVKPDLMHIIDFFIYHMKLYNVHSS